MPVREYALAITAPLIMTTQVKAMRKQETYGPLTPLESAPVASQPQSHEKLKQFEISCSC